MWLEVGRIWEHWGWKRGVWIWWLLLRRLIVRLFPIPFPFLFISSARGRRRAKRELKLSRRTTPLAPSRRSLRHAELTHSLLPHCNLASTFPSGFDFQKVYSQLSRVLSPRGTIAFWGYGEMTLPSSPHLQPLISTYQSSPSHLGPHWQQPGRSIVEALLSPIPFPLPLTTPSPTLDLLGHQPWNVEGGEPTPPLEPGEGWDPESFVRVKDGGEMGIERMWTWEQLEGYLCSSSAWHEFCRVHGDEKGRELNRVYLEGLREGTKGSGEGGEEGKVRVRWPGVVMLMGKK